MPVSRVTPKPDMRLDRAWMPLAFANADRCPSTRSGMGFSLVATIIEKSGNGDASPPGVFSTMVTAVEPPSPAWKAGLRVNDEIVSLDGVPTGPYYAAESKALRDIIEAVQHERAISLGTKDSRTVVIQPARQCDARVWYSFEKTASIYAGPATVYVSGPALDKLSPTDLTQLLAYELAHIITRDARSAADGGARMKPGITYDFKAGSVTERETGAVVNVPIMKNLEMRGTRDGDEILSVRQYPREVEQRAIKLGAQLAASAGVNDGAVGLLGRLRSLAIDTSYGRGLSDIEVETATRSAIQ